MNVPARDKLHLLKHGSYLFIRWHLREAVSLGGCILSCIGHTSRISRIYTQILGLFYFWWRQSVISSFIMSKLGYYKSWIYDKWDKHSQNTFWQNAFGLQFCQIFICLQNCHSVYSVWRHHLGSVIQQKNFLMYNSFHTYRLHILVTPSSFIWTQKLTYHSS